MFFRRNETWQARALKTHWRRLAGTFLVALVAGLFIWFTRGIDVSMLAQSIRSQGQMAIPIFIAVSTASDPELVKNTWSNPGASATTRLAASKAIGWPWPKLCA